MLRERRALLVLDNCEQMLEAAATLSELVSSAAPHVHILATSREPLRVAGEQVLHLPALGCPPDTPHLRATEALGFPAVRLFVDRVAASGYRFELTDAEAPTVGRICRRLDGIALGLELAAGRVGVYGIRGTAALLDGPFMLSWQGRRAAPARHHTLSATLDWSYNLLSAFQRLILRRLAVFGGPFSLQAVQSVSAVDADGADLIGALAALIEKSLLIADGTAAKRRYRLLETTRTYLLLKLAESGERDLVARRHAIYYMKLLEHAAQAPLLAEHARDVRAALQWAYSEQGDIGIAKALSASWAPLEL
jgi:predicted ATPase